MGAPPAGARVPSPDQDSRREQRYPVLDPNVIQRILRFGTVQRWRAGELLFETGKTGVGMFVLLTGRVAVTRRVGIAREELVVELGPANFLAEVAQLSGRPALVDARAIDDVAALLIPPDGVRALVVAEAELGETIMRALILRRVHLIESGAGGPVLVGAAGEPGLVRLQGFLSRNLHPHTVLDTQTDADAVTLIERLAPRPEDLPLVVCPDGSVLKNPTEGELAERLGFLPTIDPTHVFDVAVVGAGPAGLATAVYAASEGLSVLVLDAQSPGGQAGASARIENYLGFPTGISGQALAGRAYVQAQKFGVQMAVPAKVVRLDCAERPLSLELHVGPRVRARTVVVASGAKYRRPEIAELARFEGRGVYYWASAVEARLCGQEAVVLVGGGNSAGQAVVYLAGYAARVHLVIRGPDLRAGMSSYLVDRITGIENVEIHTETEVNALEGDDAGLSGLRWKHVATGVEEKKAIRRLFLFVGADPNTTWLADCGVALDPKGFVKTGQESLDRDVEYTVGPLETSIRGVFAIGDVRAGSTKRVAAAVGEGAAVVAQLHSHFAGWASGSPEEQPGKPDDVVLDSLAIEERAHQIFLARGGGHGADIGDWHEAERQLRLVLRRRRG